MEKFLLENPLVALMMLGAVCLTIYNTTAIVCRFLLLRDGHAAATVEQDTVVRVDVAEEAEEDAAQLRITEEEDADVDEEDEDYDYERVGGRR